MTLALTKKQQQKTVKVTLLVKVYITLSNILL